MLVRSCVCLDAHPRLWKPQPAEGAKLPQASCSSARFWQGTRPVLTAALGSRLYWVGPGCCYESSAPESGLRLAGLAPPLRIHVLVTASSYGRCWFTTEDKLLWKTALVSCKPLILPLGETAFTSHIQNGCEYLHILFCLYLICLFSINLSSHLNVVNGQTNNDFYDFMFPLLIWIIFNFLMLVNPLKTYFWQ